MEELGRGAAEGSGERGPAPEGRQRAGEVEDRVELLQVGAGRPVERAPRRRW